MDMGLSKSRLAGGKRSSSVTPLTGSWAAVTGWKRMGSPKGPDSAQQGNGRSSGSGGISDSDSDSDSGS